MGFAENKLSRWVIIGLLAVATVAVIAMRLDQSGTHTGVSLAEASLVANLPTSTPISPIPFTVDVNPQKVALGRLLFHDTRLSAGDKMSCASCHNLNNFGMDGRATSVGHDGKRLKRNTPTVFNSGFNTSQFWDGRVDTLEKQIDDLVLSTDEMGGNWPEITAKLIADADYVQRFGALYPKGIRPANVRNAIAEFERSLITPNSRFDQYLRGDEAAISDDEKQGYGAFVRYGCSSCHQGRNVGGNMFQKLGLFEPYCDDHNSFNCLDEGRRKVTGNEADFQVFRVPSLRNVAETAPYFHNGSIPSLEMAVNEMAEHQLGRSIPQPDVKNIVKFLRTLSGERVVTP